MNSRRSAPCSLLAVSISVVFRPSATSIISTSFRLVPGEAILRILGIVIFFRVPYVDERVQLREYEGEVRQVAFDGLGRDQPTLLLSNNTEETARNLLIRYAGRNRVEGGLGDCVNFFHLNCLASEVRLNVDLDAALTVLAQGCYRWLGKQLKGLEKMSPKQLFRRFVETAGLVEVEPDRVVVRLDRRSHNPILREAALDRDAPGIPWLQGRKINFIYT